MSGHRDELASIHIQTGLRETEEGSHDFRGFCTIFCTAADGFRMIGQLDPAEVRKLALNFIGGAEGAVQDAIVMNMMVRDIGAEPSIGAQLVTKMRDERHRIDPDPDDDDD
jgi:hypothetical protein